MNRRCTEELQPGAFKSTRPCLRSLRLLRLDGAASWHRECGGVVVDVRHELPCVGLSKLPEEPEAASVVPAPLISTLPPACI